MITRALPEDEERVLRLARQSPCCGTRLAADWHVHSENPRTAHEFFFAGEACVFSLNRAMALVAGQPEDSEELKVFLSFSGTRRVFSNAWAPQGWSKGEQVILHIPADGTDAENPTAVLEQQNIDPYPGINDVLEVLESTDGKMRPESARQAFYADLNARRNHRRALVCGVREDGRLVSTAGVYAFAQGEAYIACVETVPPARGRGYATRLVQALAGAHRGQRRTLICERELQGFYEKMGFVPSGALGVIADAPE